MASDQIASIAAGSVPYGERQGLEQDLAAQGGPTGLGPVAPPGAEELEGEEDVSPESILAEGPVSELPITSGLSVGPGEGPFQGIAMTTEQQRLQELALNAPSAGLRYMASLALRRIYAQQKQGL